MYFHFCGLEFHQDLSLAPTSLKVRYNLEKPDTLLFLKSVSVSSAKVSPKSVSAGLQRAFQSNAELERQ